MIEKIKNALKTEYAKLGLGEKAFDGVASFLVKTISKEEEIDGVIKSEDTKNLLRAIQGETDSLRTAKAQVEKDFTAYKESHPTTTGPNPKPQEGEDGESEIEKRLKALEERAINAEKAASNAKILSSVTARLKEKCSDTAILDIVLENASLNDGETEDAAVTRLEADYNAKFKKLRGTSPIPPHGNGGSDTEDAAAVQRRKAWVETHMADMGRKESN